MPAPAATISTARRRPAAGEWREGIERLVSRLARRAGACAACALSRRGRRLQRRRRPHQSIPARPRSCAHCLRPQDRLIACELEPNAAAALARYLARRPPRQGARDRRLDRAQRLCAAEGAARPRADRSAVRGGRRFRAPWPGARGRASQMGRPASICCGIRSRSARGPDALARRLRRRGIAKDPARRTESRAARAPTIASAAAGSIVVNPPWTLARRA